ncbi:MAG: ankyrin repeat domain-containing protein, partial [archaeon]|nr:ankyrin repeat domain-containing protein [archaeon]
NVKLVEHLLSAHPANAFPHRCDSQGLTALHWAASQGHCSLAELLIAAGSPLGMCTWVSF